MYMSWLFAEIYMILVSFYRSDDVQFIVSMYVVESIL